MAYTSPEPLTQLCLLVATVSFPKLFEFSATPQIPAVMYFLCVLLMSNMLRMPFAVVYDYAADVFYAVQFYPMPLRIVYHSLGFVGIENAVQRAFAWYRHSETHRVDWGFVYSNVITRRVRCGRVVVEDTYNSLGINIIHGIDTFKS